jgi:hypothetical protein
MRILGIKPWNDFMKRDCVAPKGERQKFLSLPPPSSGTTGYFGFFSSILWDFGDALSLT